MENQYNNNTSKQVLLSVLGVAILIVAVVGISFAAFTFSSGGSGDAKYINTVSTGTITMEYTEDSNGLTLENARPISDAQGMALQNTEDDTSVDPPVAGKTQVFDFTVKATIKGEAKINYEITAEDVYEEQNPTDTTKDGRLANESVKLYLIREIKAGDDDTTVAESYDGTNYAKVLSPTKYTPADSANALTGAPEGEMSLYKGTFSNADGTEEARKFRFKMWLTDEVTYDYKTSKKFQVRIHVYGISESTAATPAPTDEPSASPGV